VKYQKNVKVRELLSNPIVVFNMRSTIVAVIDASMAYVSV
jgi:hypothetical protein